MLGVKRQQFLNFFEGFFKRYTDQHEKLLNMGISFKPEEKSKILEHYFKKYYNESLKMNKDEQANIKQANKANDKKLDPSLNPERTQKEIDFKKEM